MTTIRFTFTGQHDNLEMAAFAGMKFYSRLRIAKKNMTVDYIIETDETDRAFDHAQDCIDLEQVENWNVELTKMETIN